MNDAPTVGSLFSGIAGLDLGLERAGFRIIWQCENNPFCRANLKHHWPGVPQFGDIRTLNTATLPVPDLIAGGFPCPDISAANPAGKGLAGERSGLWFEFARVIRDLRPRFVLVENVANLLVRGMGEILGNLAALGYDAEWECLPAAAFGAPHIRDRVFVLAYARGEQPERGRVAGGLASATRTGETRETERERVRHAAGNSGAVLANAIGARCQRGIFRTSPVPAFEGRQLQSVRLGDGLTGAEDWIREPSFCRMVDGTATRVDRAQIRAAANAVVPQIGEWIGRRVIEHMEVA